MVNNLPETMVGSYTNLDTPEARREAVGRLRTRGYTLRQIAEMLGVSLATVGNDMKKIRTVWKQNMALSYEEYVAQELAAYDDIEQQLDEAIKAGHLEMISQRTRIRERRAKLLGLDSPVKHEVTVVSIDALDSEIARLEAMASPIEEIEDDEIVDAEIVDD